MTKNQTPSHKHANPEMAQALREIRRSSAAGTHDNRPKRERSRNAVKRAEISRNAA